MMKVKSKEEIKLMEIAGRIAAEVLQYTGKFVKPGISTNELDQIANDYTLSLGAISACIGYHGYPKSICASVNEVICHGIPDTRILKSGDIINLDITVIKDGYHGDTSAMFFAGNPSESAKKLCETAYQAMMKGIEAITMNGTVGDIGFAIDKYVTRQGYHAVKEMGGHGIGKGFHEAPFVPSFGKKGKGEKLLQHGIITVEPMVNETDAPISELKIPGSSITVITTSDRRWSAQYEHTVLITQSGPKILTLC